MVALFKDRSPANVIWLIVLSIVVHSHFYFHPPHVAALYNDGLVSGFLNTYISGLSSPALIVIYHLLVMAGAIRLNLLFNDQRMFLRNNFLVAMVFILLTAVLPEWSNITPALVINPLLIWLLVKIIRLYNNPNPKTLIFNIGLVIGIGVLLYHPTALLLLVAMFALLIVRPFNLKEWMVMIMGTLTPFYFFAVYLFLTDKVNIFLLYLPQWRLNLPDTKNLAPVYITEGVIFLFVAIGMYHWQNRSRRMLIHVRKNWVLLFVVLLVMLPLPFITKNAHPDSLLLWIIPASPFIAEAFLGPKKGTFPNIMFWAMVSLIVVNNWILIKV